MRQVKHIQEQAVPTFSRNWISIFSLVVLILFFTLSFFMQGLLFKHQYLVVIGGLYMSATAIFLTRGKITFHPALYAIVAFVCYYFVAATYAINQQEALAAAFRVAIFLPLAVLGLQLTFAHRLALVRALVYLCSCLVVWGVIFNQFRDGRFEGTLDYANAWGILLLTVFVMSLMLAAIENKLHYIWLCVLLGVGILLTESRTVLVLFVITVPIQYAAFGKENRRLISTFLIKSIRTNAIVNAAILFFTVLAALFIYTNHAMSLDRLLQINTHASEWTTRLGYYHDAWQMIINSPLLGYGGGAWNILQYQYQTAAYTVLYLHNHWLETWIDIGLIGVMVFLFMVGLMIWKGISNYKQSTGAAKIWTASCLTGFGCLLVHSTVDFTFSYPVLFGLWMLLGLMIPASSNKTAPTVAKPVIWTFRIPLTVVLLLISILSIRLGMSEALFRQAEQAPHESKTIQQAIQLLEHSASLTFFPVEQHTSIAYFLLQDYLNTKQASNLNRAASEIDKAFLTNPQDVHALFLRCQIAYAQGHRTEAKQELQLLSLRFPFRTDIQIELQKWNQSH
ncbi:O-antigen ligase family protein [Paenibacillus pectinilyticus]|uniref:O-antigen ligase family protein n=1 Tax=Paenibacillus pectinilyticus TaxID=512399 RepID=UPI001ABF9837|nr:O-antigen ligase family protein [Paenibacillus pectinilyticus]